jgi:hypothetical protein
LAITQKQRAARSITQTVYYSLPLAVEIDDTAEELGISKNKLINLCTTFGLQNKDKLKEALSGKQVSNQNPRTAVVPNAVTPTPQASNSKEVNVT